MGTPVAAACSCSFSLSIVIPGRLMAFSEGADQPQGYACERNRSRLGNPGSEVEIVKSCRNIVTAPCYNQLHDDWACIGTRRCSAKHPCGAAQIVAFVQ